MIETPGELWAQGWKRTESEPRDVALVRLMRCSRCTGALSVTTWKKQGAPYNKVYTTCRECGTQREF